MKIYLLDINKNMTDAWNEYFSDTKDVVIVNEDFATFMDKHQDIEAIVSPANSFGLMDGGYDKAIIDYFGEELMKEVQRWILDLYYGEQPVGSCMSVIIPHQCHNKNFPMYLLHTPSMRTPEVIKDSRIIYQCMRTTLIEANLLAFDNIVIPAFGGLTGKVPCDEVAKMMYLAYQQVANRPSELNWGYAWHIAKQLR